MIYSDTLDEQIEAQRECSNDHDVRCLCALQ